MKIAITGGAGFIGTALAKLLKQQGHELVLIDLKKSDIFPDASHIVDITNRDALIGAMEGVGAIYHLAAEHRDDVSPAQRYYDVNVEGGKNVIAAAEAHNIQTIVFTSTVAVYPLTPKDARAGSRECDPAAPFNDYGHSKLQSEQSFLEWAETNHERSLIITRLVATFGPRNRGNIYTLMDQIARGRFVMVGDGRNRKSIAYIGNVAAFLQHCLTLTKGVHLYNYADKPDLTTKELVQDIRISLGLSGMGRQIPYGIGLMGGLTFDVAAKLTGRNFPISAIRVRKFCANTIVSAEKIKETGFIAPHSLTEGLQEMIAAEFTAQKQAA